MIWKAIYTVLSIWLFGAAVYFAVFTTGLPSVYFLRLAVVCALFGYAEIISKRAGF